MNWWERLDMPNMKAAFEANDSFKRGRQAGQEDVCREILKFDPSFAHQIAREFLAQYEPPK